MDYVYSREKDIERGEQYEQYIINRLANSDIILTRLDSVEDQLAFGDAVDTNGDYWEIKYDAWIDRCSPYRLCIEVAQCRSYRADKLSKWYSSGLFARSVAKYYVQGGYSVFFVFLRSDLVDWYNRNSPQIHQPVATSRAFYIPLRFSNEEDDWTLYLTRDLKGERYLK